MSLSSTLGTYIAGNHTKSIAPFSQFGTRRLNWFVVEIAGYDITMETGWDRAPQNLDNDWDAWRRVFEGDANSDEFLESYKSIFYPILRGIQLKAELYFVGYPNTVFDGEYPYTQLTFAVADDTQIPGESNYMEGGHPNGKSWWYEDAIDESLGLSNGDFMYDDVDVYNAFFEGGELIVLGGQGSGTDNLTQGVQAPKKTINPSFTTARAAKKAANPARAEARAARVAKLAARKR